MTIKITIRYDPSQARWVVKGTGDYDISLVDYLSDLNVREMNINIRLKENQ